MLLAVSTRGMVRGPEEGLVMMMPCVQVGRTTLKCQPDRRNLRLLYQI